MWLPPFLGRGAAAGGVAGGGGGKHARWCCAWPAHPWVLCLERGEAGVRVMWALPSLGAVVLRGPKHALWYSEQRHAELRLGRPRGFRPFHLAGVTRMGRGASGYGAVLS